MVPASWSPRAAAPFRLPCWSLRLRRRRRLRRQQLPGRRAAAAIRPNTDNARTTITVGSKNFTEQKVLGEIYAQGLEAAGYKVETELTLGDEKVAQQALKSGEIDGYPEYTGTALLSLCGVPTDDVPKDPAQAFEDTQGCFAEDGADRVPADAVHELERGRRDASRPPSAHGLQQISDLAGSTTRTTLYGTPECRRAHGLPARPPADYGLEFKRSRRWTSTSATRCSSGGDESPRSSSPPTRRTSAENIVLLEDDKGMFPPYNSTFVVRDEVATRPGPTCRGHRALQQGLTDEVMQELNARVDLDRRRRRRSRRSTWRRRPRGRRRSRIPRSRGHGLSGEHAPAGPASGSLAVRLLHPAPRRPRGRARGRGLRPARGRAVLARPGRARGRADRRRDRPAAGPRRAGRAAVRPGRPARDLVVNGPGPHRPELPRRGQGRAGQPGRRAVPRRGRRPDRAAAVLPFAARGRGGRRPARRRRRPRRRRVRLLRALGP